MEKVLEKLDNLKEEIKKEEVVKDYLKIKQEVLEDDLLKKLIEDYHKLPTEKKKEEITQTNLFKKYKEKENEVNFLILKINHEFKKLKKTTACKGD